MGALSRRRGCLLRTAAARVAVLVLPVGLASALTAAEEARSEPPVSIQVFREHFDGEVGFLAELQGGYSRASGRKVELYQAEWRESERKIKDWTGDLNRYAPDMMVVQDAQLPQVLGHAASLEGRFPPAFLKELHAGALAQGRVQGVQVALPWRAHPLALYYNADRLAEKDLAPPTSPDELLAAAGKLSAPPDLYGLGLPGQPGGGAAGWALALFRAYGGVLFDSRGRLALESDAGLRTLELFSALTAARCTQPEVLTWGADELAAAFLAGRVAMVIDGPWLLRAATLHPPAFRMGVAPAPRTPDGMEHLTADCVFIFDTARDIDGCVSFLQYALGGERQGALASLGIPSVRRDAGAALPTGEGWEVYVRALREGRGPSAATWAQVAPLLERLLYVTVSGRATPQEALDSIDVDLVDDPEPERDARPGRPSRPVED